MAKTKQLSKKEKNAFFKLGKALSTFLKSKGFEYTRKYTEPRVGGYRTKIMDVYEWDYAKLRKLCKTFLQNHDDFIFLNFQPKRSVRIEVVGQYYDKTDLYNPYRGRYVALKVGGGAVRKIPAAIETL